jgi:hypothetical protein
MRTRSLVAVTIGLGVLAAAGVQAVNLTSRASTSATGNQTANTTSSVPKGVTLRQIDGGPHYFKNKNPNSAWMDQHILIGGWLEQPLSAQDVRADVAMGNNIYWNLAGDPLDLKDCGGTAPCRANFNVIRSNGMHASAPDTTSKTGSETVSFEGTDEPDMNFGPGSNGWNPNGPYSPDACIPSGSKCGFTVAKYFYTGLPASYGSPGYPIGKRIVTQGFGKGVLFWDSNADAAKFLSYSDVISADSYWMTDSDLSVTSQGACGLLAPSSKECGHEAGTGLTTAQRALPANYAFDVSRLENLTNRSKPVTVDVETGCPGSGGACIHPSAMIAAAWQALIAGSRGIIWFQHNFSGPCIDFRTFYDGSERSSSKYNCQQMPGVTLHKLVQTISAFNHAVASLNSILLSPFAMNYVNVGKADVSVMAKYTTQAFYVFAGSGKLATPPANNQKVTFKVAGGYTGPVTVVHENRTVHAVNGVFTDTFANDTSVHIYKIP